VQAAVQGAREDLEVGVREVGVTAEVRMAQEMEVAPVGVRWAEEERKAAEVTVVEATVEELTAGSQAVEAMVVEGRVEGALAAAEMGGGTLAAEVTEEEALAEAELVAVVKEERAARVGQTEGRGSQAGAEGSSEVVVKAVGAMVAEEEVAVEKVVVDVEEGAWAEVASVEVASVEVVMAAGETAEEGSVAVPLVAAVRVGVVMAVELTAGA